MRTVLSIAGSDCSGGAGIQADIKTITAHKMYAMSVITALTAQNTGGISRVQEVSPEFVGDQLDMVLSDIKPDAVKIGMVSNQNAIDIIVKKLNHYKVKRVVLDTVILSSSKHRLLEEDAIDSLKSKLMPLAAVITPNLSEAQYLSKLPIRTKSDMLKAVQVISGFYHGSILIKGGHLSNCSDDLLYDKENYHWFKQIRINNPNTHGTGCTLSSAIACNLAEGKDIKSSISNAKEYITGAIAANLKLGSGNGPLNHCWKM